MSNSISGGISFSGIGSGTDFSAMIEQLLEVESFRLNSLQDTRDVASETYEAFQDLLSTVSEAQEALSLLNTYEEFLTKIASSSSEATLGVKADANAVDGTHTIDVKQLASNAIWANKGSYESKNTVLNSSGVAQEFSYTYKGETRTLSVPAGTTLEGFANMVNQDKANPGVNVSILKTGSGYSFQVSGDDSGAEASLEIHPSNLLGLSGAGGVWESSATVDASTVLNGGTTANSYTYALTMQGSSTVHNVTIDGDKTQQDLADAINAEVGSTVASITDGKLTIAGLDKMDITSTPAGGGSPVTETVEVHHEATMTFSGSLTGHTMTGPATYTFTDEDGVTPVEISMTGGHTQKDILDALKAKGYGYTTTNTGSGTEVVIEGITGIPTNFLETDISHRGTVSTASLGMSDEDLTPLLASEVTAGTYQLDTGNGTFVEVVVEAGDTVQTVLDDLQDRGYEVAATQGGGFASVTVAGVSSLQPLLDATVSKPTSVSAGITGSNINVPSLTGTTITGPVSYSFSDGSASLPFTFTEDHTLQDVLNRLDEFSALTGKTFYSTSETADGRTSVTFAGNMTIDGSSDPNAFLNIVDSTQGTTPTVTTDQPDYETAADADATIQSGVVPEEMTFSFTKEDGTVVDVAMINTDTVQDMLDKMATAGLSGSIDATTGKLVLNGITSVQGVPASLGLAGSLTGSDAWEVQASQDAIFKVDNWPQELTSSSNEVTGVLEGITLSFRDEGKAQITVAADTDSVKANIQTVLDAFNSVLKKVQDLTAITEDVASYTEDGQSLANTSGAALTGDYSVQLFTSRFKSEITSSPPGFQPMTAGDIFSGDLISGLAQMGIKVSSDVESEDFGLFTIAPHGTTESMQALDQAAFDDAIANHLEEVIAFFANDNEGRSSSPNFRYSNHVDGITEPGTYDVSYDVNASGVPVNVYINGVLAAASESDPNTFTAGSDAGAAGGMAITIDNLTPGTNYSGTVSIQKGKVSQIEDFLAAELKYSEPKESDPGLGDDNGGLKIGERGAWNLIEQLDTQIAEEQTRLDRWENTQRLKFARLDTLLGTYNGQMEMLNQQLAQLG